MHVQIAANLANGLYFCLELGIAALLTYCLSTIVTAWHARKLYLTKTGITLSPSRLYVLSEHGVTSKGAHRVIAFLTLLVISLLAIGDLSMVGVTNTTAEDVQVEYVVTRVPGNRPLDLTEHQSVNARNVTGAFLQFANLFSCRTPVSNGFKLAEYYSEEEDHSGIESRFKWNRVHFSSHISSVACLSKRKGFIRDYELFEVFREEIFDVLACKISVPRFLQLNSTLGSVQPGKAVQVQGLNFKKECLYKIDEIWCIYGRDKRVSCAGRFLSPAGNEHLMMIDKCGRANQGPNGNCRFTVSAYFANGLLEYPALKSIVFLRQIPQLSTLHEVNIMLLPWLTLQRSKTVQVGELQDVTEVNTLFFVLTTGIALLVTLAAVLTAIFMWVRYLYVPNLRKLNCFNSAEELLSAAADVAFTGSLTVHRRRNVRVGTWNDLPRTGPVPEAEQGANREVLEAGFLFGESPSQSLD